MKKIYLVRHGETNANLKGYVPGKDESLNATGFLQADSLAQRVHHLDFDVVIASDFLRAQQTVKPISTIKNTPVQTVPSFGEMFEPTSIHGLLDEDEEVIGYRKNRNANIENHEWRQEDGENFLDLFNRITEAKKFIEISEVNNLLIVSHCYFLQMFVAAILLNAQQPTKDWFNIGQTLKMSNTGITLLTEDSSHWRVVTWNDHAHFAE